MTPLLRQFADDLEKAGDLPALSFHSHRDGSPALVVQAACEEIGDLSIHDDGDELTVVIGELHHTHYSSYCYDGESKEARLAKAASDAAAFVSEILADRIRITVRYKGSQCIGSAAKHINAEKNMGETIAYPFSAWWFRQARTDRYLWSGRIP